MMLILYMQKTRITTKGNDVIESVISHSHDQIVYIKKTIIILKIKVLRNENKKCVSELNGLDKITFSDIIKFIKSCTVDDLNYLNEISEINMNIVNYGLNNVIHNSFTENYLKILTNDSSLYQRIILNTAAAIDAHTSGASLPVATSCESGDHGLTSTIP